ncbi:MAG TPA: MFS transporter [Burkholderiales bacterium]
MPASFRLGAFYFAFFLYVGLMLAYLPAYLASRGLGAAQIAAVLALPQVVRMFAPALWGWVADRTGAQRAIVAAGCAANALCFLLVPAVSGALGIALLVGGMWLDRHAAGMLPPALVLCGLASLAAAAALPDARLPAAPAARSFAVPRAARRLLACGFCMAAAHGTLYAFFTLHLQRAGYGGTLIGALWTLGVLAEIVVFLVLPALFRRASLSAILAASCLIGVLRFLIVGWGVASTWLLVAAQLMHAATFGAFHAAAVAGVQRLFPQGAHARGQTLFSSIAYGAGGAAGALSAGWAWEAGGPGAAFSLSALAAALGVFLAYPLKRAGL